MQIAASEIRAHCQSAPLEPPAAVGLTFGDYIALVRSKNLIPEKTLNGYLQRLRRITRSIRAR